MKIAAFAFAAALAAFSAARADVIPPPEEITEVQQALVGVWQQTAATGMMGHGEGVETLAFDKEKFGSIYLFALPPSAMYEATTRRGAWAGERISPTEIKVTLTWEDGTAPTEVTYTLSDPGTLEVKRGIGRHGEPVIVTYKKIYP